MRSEPTSGEVVALRLPEPERLFARRAARLAALAHGHPLGDWLLFLGRVAQGQRRAAGGVRPASVGVAAGAHPLDPRRTPPAPAWRVALAVVLDTVYDAPMPAEARNVIDRLRGMGPGALDALAGRVLAGSPTGDDLAAAPFAAAGLQVHLASLAALLDPGRVERSLSTCPACGTPPVAGIVQGDGLRYLACGLCGCEWHLTRLQCTSCLGTGALQHLEIEGGGDGVKAEACPACGSYLKLLYRERRPDAEPIADDLATLALDVLVAEAGWRRYGANLLLATADG